MAYLHRRVEHLLKMLKDGSLLFPADMEKKKRESLLKDLRKIKRDQQGNIDLKSCSSEVISLAKMVYMMEKLRTKSEAASIKPSSDKLDLDLNKIQNEFFNIIDDFFKHATGKDAESFATPETFGEEIRRNPIKFAQMMKEAFQEGQETLMGFYSKYKADAYPLCRQLGGIKLTLGGSQRFFDLTLQSIKSMLLYVDTILVPDPILPWIEVERKEEKYRHVNMLEAMFLLLRLKPLVNADLPYPAVIIFPSWEKSLESQDAETLDLFSRLILDFFSYYLEINFEDESEILEYANSQEEKFLEHIDRKNLFFSPEGKENDSINEHIKKYKDSILTWRSSDYIKYVEKLKNSELVLQGIIERLNPQFHLRENAESMGAQPMLWLQQHWHYFKLCASMYNESLVKNSILKTETVATLVALNQPEFQWLGNVPIKQIIELRQESVSLEFRNRLKEFTNILHETALEDLDKVVVQVSKGISSLLTDHQKKIQEVEEKYQKRHLDTIIASWITLAAMFFPWLAPYAEIIPPLALTGKYIKDKVEEGREKKRAARSLTGVLAATHKK